MTGRSWDEREPNDWLASNGRWYPATKYPKGWSTTALPPAPGHGDIGSILRRFVEAPAEAYAKATSATGAATDTTGAATGNGTASSWTVGSATASSDTSSPPRPPGSAVVPTGRRVADATISDPLSTELPPAPGRLMATESAPPMPKPPAPARPAMPAPPTASAAAKPKPPATEKSDIEVVAGDLGRVLGSAKRRIEKAINEAAEQ